MGQVPGQPLLLVLLGEAARSDSPAPGGPASISMPLGPQKGIVALQTLVLLPSWARLLQGLVWPASITMTHRPSEGHGSSLSLRSAAPLRYGCRR